jgi:dienelactone hydrolase
MTKIINSWFVGSNSRKSALTIYIDAKIKKQPLLLFVHGFKGFKDWGHFPLICEKIADKGIAIIAFNFTHNGGTEVNSIDFPDLEAFSQNSYSKEVKDVGCLYDWIKSYKKDYFSNIDFEKISILGHSRGGGIALLASHKYSFIQKVITWAAVADFEERLPPKDQLVEWEKSGIHIIKNGRTKQEMPMRYEFVEDLINNALELKIENAVKNMTKPLLLIHGEEDETVDRKDAERIHQWSSSSTLLMIKACNHTFNGKHPWNSLELPLATIQAVNGTVEYIKTKNFIL